MSLDANPAATRVGKPERIESIGLLVSLHKHPALPCARAVVDCLRRRGVQVRGNEELATHVQGIEVGDDAFVHSADVLLVVGGDGTILRAARTAAPLGTPILGVYVSGFGFLTEATSDGIDRTLEDVLAGSYTIDERIMLTAHGERDPGRAVTALNDIVVRRERAPGMIDCYLWVSDTFVGEYRGDGLIAATPTGSTCYSLAAYGPVVTPWLDAVVLAPMCVFTLNIRPLVIRADEEVRIEARYKGDEPNGVTYSADGLPGIELKSGETLVVTKAPHKARFVRFEPGTFYTRLRQRLKWGAEI